MTMQTLYGIIPNVYGKGKYSKVKPSPNLVLIFKKVNLTLSRFAIIKIVAEQLFRMRREMPQNQEPQIIPKIDNLILVDRTVDLITPMMTQLTYEGLVDENFGIKYSSIICYLVNLQRCHLIKCLRMNSSSVGDTARPS
jgi:hypothetical protein